MLLEAKEGGVCAVIGDVVESRKHPSRPALQSALDTALKWVSDFSSPLQPLTMTIGDEFQGVFANPGAGIEATALVRVALRGLVDVRFGLGWGLLTTFEPSAAPFRQDGPAWWAAREAVDAAKRESKRQEKPKERRTAFKVHPVVDSVGAKPESSPGEYPLTVDFEALLDSHLVLLDSLLAGMKADDLELVAGLLAGDSLASISKRLGVSSAASSQRANRGGAYALVAYLDRLRAAFP